MFDKLFQELAAIRTWLFPKGIGRRFTIALVIVSIGSYYIQDQATWKDMLLLVLGFYFGSSMPDSNGTT